MGTTGNKRDRDTIIRRTGPDVDHATADEKIIATIKSHNLPENSGLDGEMNFKGLLISAWQLNGRPAGGINR